jgi:cytochrome c
MSGALLLSVQNMLWASESVSTEDVPVLGQALTADQRSALPVHVFADGEGLPPGEGTAEQGAQLYAQLCSGCHGSAGQGGRALELVGDRSLLNTEFPDRGIAVYWPNAPTLYEYIYRAMPPDKPASLDPEQMYSLIAYLLQLNDLLPEDGVMNAAVLRDIVMPNHAGFITIAE